ncbi:hypothetical protein ANO11243_097100 [Dothideomycetidae sp. 11243]|nr:hypothetical protein ANO11243_097100 [fungal sp. No.11243]
MCSLLSRETRLRVLISSTESVPVKTWCLARAAAVAIPGRSASGSASVVRSTSASGKSPRGPAEGQVVLISNAHSPITLTSSVWPRAERNSARAAQMELPDWLYHALRKISRQNDAIGESPEADPASNAQERSDYHSISICVDILHTLDDRIAAFDLVQYCHGIHKDLGLIKWKAGGDQVTKEIHHYHPCCPWSVIMSSATIGELVQFWVRCAVGELVEQAKVRIEHRQNAALRLRHCHIDPIIAGVGPIRGTPVVQ